jgi:hypothetical protein
MTLFTIVLLLAQTAPASLEQIRAEPNLEHRARAAIEYAAAAERGAETAYTKSELSGMKSELQNMVMALEIARQALEQTGKSPVRHPGPFKFGEMRTQETLVRLNDFEHRVEPDERSEVASAKQKVQEIHDVWLEGIMSKKK